MSHPKRTNSFQPWQQCPGTIPLDYLAAVELANIHSRTERKNVLAEKKSSAWDVFLSPNIVMTYHHRFPHVGYEASVRLERTETQGAKTGRKEQSGVFFINIPPTTQPAKKYADNSNVKGSRNRENMLHRQHVLVRTGMSDAERARAKPYRERSFGIICYIF